MLVNRLAGRLGYSLAFYRSTGILSFSVLRSTGVFYNSIIHRSTVLRTCSIVFKLAFYRSVPVLYSYRLLFYRFPLPL